MTHPAGDTETEGPKFDRQIRNLARLVDDLSSRREVFTSHPWQLEFATSNACNLRCVHCPHHDGLPLRRADLDLATRVLDEFLPEGGLLSPMDLSEPFAGDMDLCLARCEEHDAWLNLITNATLLTEDRLARVLPRTHRLFLSIETFDPGDFAAIRIGASLQRVISNCRSAVRIARSLRVPVTFVTVLMRPIHGQLPAYVEQVAAMGGTEVLVLELLPTFPRFENYRVAGVVPERDLLAIRDAAVEAAVRGGIGLTVGMPPPLRARVDPPPSIPRVIHTELAHRMHGEIFRIHGHFCHHAATYVKVDTEGRVFPCCRAPAELLMGDLRHQSLADVWNGGPWRNLRRRMHSGDLPAPCRDCGVLKGHPFYRPPRRGADLEGGAAPDPT